MSARPPEERREPWTVRRHNRPDGSECPYVAAFVCNKCGTAVERRERERRERDDASAHLARMGREIGSDTPRMRSWRDRRTESPAEPPSTNSAPIGSDSVGGPSGASEGGERDVVERLEALSNVATRRASEDTLTALWNGVGILAREAAAEIRRLRASVERPVGEGGAGVGSQAGGVLRRAVVACGLIESATLDALLALNQKMDKDRDPPIADWDWVRRMLRMARLAAMDVFREQVPEWDETIPEPGRVRLNLRAWVEQNGSWYIVRALGSPDTPPTPSNEPATPEGSEGVETRAGFAAYMPAHWRETLTENPRWIVGATLHPDAAESWERVEIRPSPEPGGES